MGYKLKIPFRIKVISIIFGPFLRYWRQKQLSMIYRRFLPKLLNKVKHCHTQSDWEKFLGKPKRIMNPNDFYGDNYYPSSVKNKPDTVIMYIKRKCNIFLHLKDNQIVYLSGAAMLSPWDFCAKTKNKCMKKVQAFFNKEEEVLSKDLDSENLRLFLKNYFSKSNDIIDDVFIPIILDEINLSGKYKTLADLKEILRKTNKIRKALHQDGWGAIASCEFIRLYSYVHPEILENKHLKQLLRNYSDNDLIEKQKYFEKFKHLIEI